MVLTLTPTSPGNLQLAAPYPLSALGVYNVVDYGAVAGGVADCRPAFLAAAAAADALGVPGDNASGSAIVYIPAGTYALSAGIDCSNYDKITFAGAGTQVTFIKLTTGATGDGFYGTRTDPSGASYVMFRDFTLYGNSTTTGHGFNLTHFHPFLRFENVEVQLFTDGFRLNNCYTFGMVKCDALVNRGWGFNFNRNNDDCSPIACNASSNGVGGIRCADGFIGPLEGANAIQNPIGILFEHSASQGTGDYGTSYAPMAIGCIVEGNASQTVGIKAVTATAVKQRLSLIGCRVFSGGGDLVNLAGVQYGYLAALDTMGDGSTTRQLVLAASTTDTMVVGHTNGPNGTVFTDSGTNNSRLTQDGWSALKTYGNFNVYLAAGDANPQIALSRDGGGNPAIAFGAGGGAAVTQGIIRNGSTGLTVTGGEFDMSGAARIQTHSRLFSGTGAPAGGTGSNGDYYLRDDGGVGTHLYFKAAGSWAGLV